MFSALSRLRWLSVVLTLVLVAPPLGGRLSDRPAAQVASRPTSGAPAVLTGVACASPSTCVAVGAYGSILRTTDGGSTWRGESSGTDQYLTGVACRAPSTCVAVGSDGSSGSILRSTDRGRTWRSQSIFTQYALHGVACASASTCLAVGGGTIAVGYGGTILRSTDGGRPWRCTSRGHGRP